MLDTNLVGDWMTPDPVTVSMNTRLHDARKLMYKHNVRRLPVIDGARLVGILTLGDIYDAEPPQAPSLNKSELNYLLSKMNVRHVMSPKVYSVNSGTSIADAARLMFNKKIAALPVMEDEHLVGIITESDIFRMVVKTLTIRQIAV